MYGWMDSPNYFSFKTISQAKEMKNIFMPTLKNIIYTGNKYSSAGRYLNSAAP